jgi:glycosidase
MEQFQIDGLRMDAADCIDMSFLQTLNQHCKQIDKDFWIMGEIIHGDYSRWINCGGLDSVTNYECYKGLYSSHNDHNYFEIAYSLNRQFGPEGMYRHFLPYSFADNHDVNRLTSTLTHPEHVFPLYCLLFSMPGIPSLYYGSEWGIGGSRTATDDHALRPRLEPENDPINSPFTNLPAYIARLSEIRLHSPALQRGTYRQVSVSSEQFAFLRQCEAETLLCVVNASSHTVRMEIEGVPGTATRGKDLLSNTPLRIEQNRLSLSNVSPCSGMIIALEP